MTITNFWSSTISQTVAPSGTTTPSSADLLTSPASLSPTTFVSWDHDDQIAYIKAHASGSPPSYPRGSRRG